MKSEEIQQINPRKTLEIVKKVYILSTKRGHQHNRSLMMALHCRGQIMFKNQKKKQPYIYTV